MPDVAALHGEHDLLLHDSGPSLIGGRQVEAWRARGTKPYGIPGITLGNPAPRAVEFLGGAAFVWFRDTVPLQAAEAAAAFRGTAAPLPGRSSPARPSIPPSSGRPAGWWTRR